MDVNQKARDDEMLYIINTYDFDVETKELMNRKTKRILKRYEYSDGYFEKNDIDKQLDWMRYFWNIRKKKYCSFTMYHIFQGIHYEDLKKRYNLKI